MILTILGFKIRRNQLSKCLPLVWARDLCYCGVVKVLTLIEATCLVFRVAVQNSSTIYSVRTWSRNPSNKRLLCRFMVSWFWREQREDVRIFGLNFVLALGFSKRTKLIILTRFGKDQVPTIHWFKPKNNPVFLPFSLGSARMVENKTLRSCLAGGKSLQHFIRGCCMFWYEF